MKINVENDRFMKQLVDQTADRSEKTSAKLFILKIADRHGEEVSDDQKRILGDLDYAALVTVHERLIDNEKLENILSSMAPPPPGPAE